jgi:hypothetical protein
MEKLLSAGYWLGTSLLAGALLFANCSRLSPLRIIFLQSATTVEVYDFVEITANVSTLAPGTPSRCSDDRMVRDG